MTEKSLDSEAQVSSPLKHGWRNLDIASATAFVSAAVLGAFGVANNVRHAFWNNFIQGFNEIETPFAPIRNKYRAMFSTTAAQKSAGTINATDYRNTMRTIANDYRNEVATKLLKDFIKYLPTESVDGRLVLSNA